MQTLDECLKLKRTPFNRDHCPNPELWNDELLYFCGNDEIWYVQVLLSGMKFIQDYDTVCTPSSITDAFR